MRRPEAEPTSDDTRSADTDDWLERETIRQPRPLFTRRQFLGASLTLAGAGLAAGLYTWQVEPHWLELVSRPLRVRNLPSALVGKHLALLADIHVGLRVSEDYVLGTFRRVAALEPDIVVIAGDFTSYHDGVIEQAKRIYSQMPHGKLATVGVLGNHDYGLGWSDQKHADRLSATLRELGIVVLRDQVVDVSGLRVIGIDDLWGAGFRPDRAFAGVDHSRSTLAIAHNPDVVDLPGWEGFAGWILAGHTHGGQCKPPFLPPPMLPVKNRRYTSGEFGLSGGRELYISRGVGHLLQVRFNVRPEITLFRLTAS